MPDDLCPLCKGQRFRGIYDETGLFVGRGRCPECNAPEPWESFFQDLKTTKDNKAAIEAAMEMAQHPEGWLVLKGDRGTGKTTLARAILSAWCGRTMHPWQTGALLDYWRSRYDAEDFDRAFYSHCGAEVFVLDDLGSERATPWALEKLTIFLIHREENRLTTVITTNLDEQKMAAKYDDPRIPDRVFDRGTGLVRLVTVTGPSWRTGRSW